MKHSDEAIDSVLAGLRNAEVPAGMEHRILAAARRRASTQSASAWRPAKPLWLLTLTNRQLARRAASAVAVAGIFAIVTVAVTAIHRHPATQSKLHSNPIVLPAPANLGTDEPDAHVTPRTPITQTRSKLYMPSAHLIAADVVSHSGKRRSLSKPAPEAPLTQQEKLLLRIAQSGNPHELAMLNSEIRTRREAQDDAEFQEFVERSIASSNGGGE
jgi:hypothetical protein